MSTCNECQRGVFDCVCELPTANCKPASDVPTYDEWRRGVKSHPEERKPAEQAGPLDKIGNAADKLGKAIAQRVNKASEQADMDAAKLMPPHVPAEQAGPVRVEKSTSRHDSYVVMVGDTTIGEWWLEWDANNAAKAINAAIEAAKKGEWLKGRESALKDHAWVRRKAFDEAIALFEETTESNWSGESVRNSLKQLRDERIEP